MLASFNGNIRIVELLLENGADINAGDYSKSTPLNEAALKGRYDIAELLVNNSANVNTQQNLGDTLLMRSIYSTSTIIMDINSELKEHGKNLTDEEKQAIRDDYKKVTDLLIKSGADVNLGCDRQRTPVFACIIERRNDLLKIIIEAGGNLEHINSDGERPIHFIMTVAKRVKHFEKELTELLVTLIESAQTKEL